MNPEAPPRSLTIIADLHMSAGPGDDFVEDRALVGLLDRLTDGATLLILGDLLDFSKLSIGGRRTLDSSAEATLAKLEVAASAHRDVFAALGRAAAAGVALEIVPGNHDAVLLRPPVRDRLSELLAAELRVHPWFFHLPGVLYAEHGHQHHDINRIPELFDPGTVERGGPLRTPVGIHLAHYLNEREEQRGRPVRQAAAALRCLPPATVAGVRMLRREHSPVAVETSLPVAATSQLAAQSTPTARGLVGRVLRRDAADRYMQTAAARIDRALSGVGAAAPFYAFGHTHIAADRSLGSGTPAARYLNPGSWSRLRAAGTPPHYLELDLDPDRPQAALLAWDGAAPAPSSRQSVSAA